jgi:ubiquinol-cytochrome c reductase cytochrome c subunit
MRPALFFVLALVALDTLAAGDAEKGQAAFVRHGCYECHGFAGQGASTGKTLAPNPLPFEAFSVFVRNTSGAMPPYQKAILSDEDLADIYAYLHSIPAAPDFRKLPLP